ncbi:MAG: twin-arginine translocation signal domain-containing protein [Acidimicrobiia bacterium]|nr:twin-arginine translocation signal domain-containing protein [Acidimicrobiia bacterium]
MERRRFLYGAAATAAAAVSLPGRVGASMGSPAPASAWPAPGGALDDVLAPPGSRGLISERYYQRRIKAYLQYATEFERFGSPPGIAVHLIQAHRDPDYIWNVAGVTNDELAPVWTQIDEWRDTRDFQFMYLNWVYVLGRGDTPMTRIDPAVIAAYEQRLVDNRYRYNDPLPADRVDHLWYWSENHRIIVLANESLAGQFLPDEVFTITGLTGAEHKARAKPDILEWIHERARFGFFEWHSNVYMVKNITPLLMLCELSDDPEIVQAAAMALDLCLFDMAAHYHRGAYVAPHGRTYKKDKMTARDEDCYGFGKFLFDDTDPPFVTPTDSTTTFFCAAQRYRPPFLVHKVAREDDPTVTRERHGVWADASEPIVDDPVAPFGYDYDDPANLNFWWSTGGIGMWQLAEMSVAEADAYRLWESDSFQLITQLRDVNGGDVDRIKEWEQANHMILNLGFLAEGNSYAYRTQKVALASVLDHRKGEMRDQVHMWQATIDTDARVFTTHPTTDVAASTNWRDDGEPGYWTGEASMPRSAQHRNSAIHIYLPSYDETQDPILWAVFGYRDFTHAYFPQDHFDQVVQVGHWTIGAKDGGYIALWSWREPAWRVYDPAVNATNGMVQPFDLVASGGPDNVWITEVGTDDDGSFDDFVAAITASTPDITRTADGFDVAWQSPTNGLLSFGWDAPFAVDGVEQQITDFPRHDSRWGRVDRLATRYELRQGRHVLELDFDAGTRSVRRGR